MRVHEFLLRKCEKKLQKIWLVKKRLYLCRKFIHKTMTKKGLTEQLRFLPSLLGPDKIIVLFVRHLSLLFNKATSPYSNYDDKKCLHGYFGKQGRYMSRNQVTNV
jgi:hypothetical protein